MPKILELFSGTQSISNVFRAAGWATYTLDFDSRFEDKTDWTVDILTTTPQDFINRFGKPDVIWASPPCTTFSVASIGRHWNHEGTPKTEAAEVGLKILEHTIYLIEELDPEYFFIENPRGKMRKMDAVSHLDRYTVTYCQYGDNRMKPTDIWTNHPDPNFKLACKNGMPCHVAAPRGSQTGTQGMKNAMEKARIPRGLCEHILDISKVTTKYPHFAFYGG